MAQEKKYFKRSQEERDEDSRRIAFVVAHFSTNIENIKQELKKQIDELGIDGYIDLVARARYSNNIESEEYKPNPENHPELRDGIAKLPRGYPTEGVEISRIGNIMNPSRLRIELPINAKVRDYLKVIEVYQEFLLSLEDQKLFIKYLASKKDDGATWEELTDEVNNAMDLWEEGKTTELDIFNLDGFLRRKGRTPDSCKWFKMEEIRRTLRYFVDKK